MADWIPHHALVEPHAPPAAWAFMLHGLLGTGANWRGIARKLVAARPDWGVVMVDQRLHGRSRDAPPPHTVAAAAGDLARLAAHLAEEGRPVRAVVGHSFGGKVALAWRATAPSGLLDTWVMDSPPGARLEALTSDEPGSVMSVLELLASLAGRHASREAFVAALVARGTDRALADWLAMNLEPEDGAFVLRLDFDGLRALVADFYRLDMWPAAVSRDLPGAVRVVAGARSPAVSADDEARLRAAGVEVHRVADAGHFLHVDQPAEVVRLLSERLSPPTAA